MEKIEPSTTPTFMKAAQASAFGPAVKVLTVQPSVGAPPPPTVGHVQIAVHACSLSPSDYRMLSGDTDLVKKPAAWPYIPGGDVSGVVTAVHENETRLKIGDRVIGTWDTFGIGGMAELTNVDTRYVERMSDAMSFVDAAAFADSSVNALLAVEDASLKKGDTLLLLGGSGAVGTALIQLARRQGVSRIVTTTTDEQLARRLGADDVVNYRKHDWWTCKTITQYAPYDAVIDCAEGSTAWDKVQRYGLAKTGREGGRFLAVVVNEWHIAIHTVWQLLGFLLPVLHRAVASCVFARSRPKYKMLFPAPRGNSLERLLCIVEEGGLEVVIDPSSPLPFTTEGVREAFETMVERRGHGKVVVKIRDED